MTPRLSTKPLIYPSSSKFRLYIQKKTRPAAEKEKVEVQQKRVDFWEKIREIKVEDLIFIDESGVNLARLRLYARALKGKRARGEKPQKRGRNISIIRALSLEKVLAATRKLISTNIYGSVDGVTYEAFIVKQLVPLLDYFGYNQDGTGTLVPLIIFMVISISYLE